jgi:4-amino-4-deoxy-L-arabinose transferase-like glycosyltransferase
MRKPQAGLTTVPASLAGILPGPLPLILVLLCVLTVFRLVSNAASGTDLFVDESQYWSWSRDLAFGYFSKPPLLAWLIAGATALCGDGEACVRAPSPLLHAGTALMVFFIGRRLYSGAVGFWSALAFALLPGISLSAGIISTDVPLLFCWSVALLAFVLLLDRPGMGPALLLGAALGLGLNAKYAMAYFVLCSVVALVLIPRQRALPTLPYLGLALAVGAALIVPNIVWNADNGFATFSHTAHNAGWNGVPFHPEKALEFLATQFGVFGPILFGALAVLTWRVASGRESWPEADRVLLSFSLPVIAIVTVQAFLSHALANWAAPAYVAASVLVTAALVRENSWGWLKGSLALALVVQIVISQASLYAGRFALPGAGDPFARTLGNRALADAIGKALGEKQGGAPYGAVLADDRGVISGLLYYGRDLGVPVMAWVSGGVPQDHFELTRGYRGDPAGWVLLVSRVADPREITGRFAEVTTLGPRTVPAGDYATRTVYLFSVRSWRGAAS